MKQLLLFSAGLLLSLNGYGQACTGAPASNSVVASATNICLGNTTTLSLFVPYTTTGIFYQWAYATTSAGGPWSQVSGANSPSLLTTGLTQSGWYTCVIACANSLMTTTAAPVYLSIGSASTTTTVPYYEGFEDPVPNTLPGCGWTATNLGVNSICFPFAVPGAAPCSGLRMAGFSYSASALGTNEFYTQGINLNAGIAYSVALWQKTSVAPADNWNNFGIGIGPSQAVAGGTVVYSNNSPATTVCSLRSASFSVPSSGVYYVRIFANSVAGTTVSPYLIFDDLSITAPCSLAPNSASTTVSTNSIVVCSGDSSLVTFTPSPNCNMLVPPTNNAYIGATSMTSSNYSFVTTNTLSGCTSTGAIQVFVNPRPSVFALLQPNQICSGTTGTVSAYGAQNFTLLPPGTVGNSHTIAPSASAIYTIIGSSAASCTNMSTLAIPVVPSPTITLSVNSVTVCTGEKIVLQAFGANNYSIGTTPFTNTVQVSAPVGGTYTVQGMSLDGCLDSALLTVFEEGCAGFDELEDNMDYALLPNPANKQVTINCHNALFISLLAANGTILKQTAVESVSTTIDIADYPAGLYFINITSPERTTSLRLVIQ